MEQAEIVSSTMMRSPHGPDRKIYYLSKSLSVTVDIAPNLFSEHIVTFNLHPTKNQISGTSSSLFENLIADIDNKLLNLENERSVLLYIRNAATKEAQNIIKNLEL